MWSNSVPAAPQFESALSISEIEGGVAAKERNDAEQATYCAPGSTKCCCLVSQGAFGHWTVMPIARWGLSEYLNMHHSIMR